MRIGELAAATGASPRALRYYEQQGLLRPERSYNGYRDYREDQVPKVEKIRGLLGAGMPISLIGQILPCFDGDESIYEVISNPEIIAQLLEHRTRLDAKVTGIQACVTAIDEYVSRVGERTPRLVAENS